MRTGFNWWYVTTIMSLVIVGITGYLNTHEVDGRKRKKRLCGRFLLKVLTTILTVIFVVLVSTESYDGIVELCLDFCLSDGDSAAWADLLAFLAIGMTTIIFSEILENIVRFGSRLPVKPRCGRVYKCASSQRLAAAGGPADPRPACHGKTSSQCAFFPPSVLRFTLFFYLCMLLCNVKRKQTNNIKNKFIFTDAK